MTEYIVDRWFLWSDNTLRKQRFRDSTREAAERRFEGLKEFEDTTRIRLSIRNSPKTKPSPIKIWDSFPAH